MVSASGDFGPVGDQNRGPGHRRTIGRVRQFAEMMGFYSSAVTQ